MGTGAEYPGLFKRRIKIMISGIRNLGMKNSCGEQGFE
jgi:hypothetical protein